ncbi:MULTISPECIES: hypothetical protein [Streptomyces]|uniref:hypothetical protein n=1 Tax=Streptomyces TaxID=1883 RepID=UPI00093E70B1|nr:MULTISPECIES: hypothetical protein [unclassified Streptomyces]OKJ01207.1 hypothetical protein AMK20_34830 [Streptomyces sp. TSRI0261]QNQ35721.1 hypothetical protein HYC88_19895 [Streptomyces sp. CB00271]
MRVRLGTVISFVTAGVFVCALASPAQAVTEDSGWQLRPGAEHSVTLATGEGDARDNNGNS